MEFSWLSIVPPLVAIVLALVTQEVLLSLFVAILVGASIYSGSIVTGFTSTLNNYMVGALTDSWNISILVFCLSIGGLIGIIGKNGGTAGIGKLILNKATSTKSALLTTWGLGILIFFDDYANSLIVGNTMKGITDKMLVPREKLAYIIDSTAAPVSSIALVSTWVGMELGLIQSGLDSLGLDIGSYSMFLQSIPYRFYSLLSLGFVLIIILTGKDFGPMAKAEKRAKEQHILNEGEAKQLMEDEYMGKAKWYNAIIPLLVVIVATIVGLYINGGGTDGSIFDFINIRNAFGNADASVVLLWSSFLGIFTAVALTLVQRIMSLKDIVEAWVDGVKSMTVASMILVLAWSLGRVNSDLGTAKFIVSMLSTSLPAFLVPVTMFIVPAVIAFATGTSWGANSIVMPLAIPLAYQLGGVSLLAPSIGAVLTGAVLGDHISPVSDTTIMSSMASGCNHINHVKTQIPYALLVCGVSILFGFIPAGMGIFPYWVSYAVSFAVLIAVVLKFGKNYESKKDSSESSILAPAMR